MGMKRLVLLRVLAASASASPPLCSHRRRLPLPWACWGSRSSVLLQEHPSSACCLINTEPQQQQQHGFLWSLFLFSFFFSSSLS